MASEYIDALIFDLDGVITQTRSTHEKAWEELFNEFLKSRDGQDPVKPGDYSRYIDGKPRYEGVKSFLASRDISLPFGGPDDPPGDETVCALGNKKNEIFNKVVKEEGVETYPHVVEKIRQWRREGFKTAIVSSSKNCKMIIEQAGIDQLFDVRVDGKVSEERGLRGKPDPDIFVEATLELGACPTRSVVFEDAISGVQAGASGFFGLVVGVARFDNKQDLLDHGADIAIADFKDFSLTKNESILSYFKASRPMIFAEDARFFDEVAGKTPAFFLDYDGTLTPIVQRPEDAVISDEMRETLKRLAARYTVAVVTGRDLDDVKNFIQLDNIIYSGSHGFVISGPDGLYKEHEKGEQVVKLLDKVEESLHALFDGKAEGVQIDRKRYAIAVHYRNAPEKDVPYVFEVVDKMLDHFDGLKTGEGKMVVELKPDIDWHKGKAVLWILEALGLDKNEDVLPVFIGDDVTDEDAFRALQGKGTGILVENRGQDTAANYSLKDVYQVRRFFETFLDQSQ
ncbi:MAG: trehalose-phosphatase [Bacteroidales bacterium]